MLLLTKLKGGPDPPPERHNVDYIIETDFEGPGFVPVPNAVAQHAALSAEALGVLVYLASLPRGFVLRVGTVQERFGIGKDKWQRIARELREVGAMDAQPVRGSGGRVVGKRVAVRWPRSVVSTESRETRLSDRKPENPTVGKPAKRSRKTRQTEPENPVPYKDKHKNLGGLSSQSPRAAPSVVLLDQVADLSAFVRSSILSDRAVLVGRTVIQPGSPEMLALRDALRAEG